MVPEIRCSSVHTYSYILPSLRYVFLFKFISELHNLVREEWKLPVNSHIHTPHTLMTDVYISLFSSDHSFLVQLLYLIPSWIQDKLLFLSPGLCICLFICIFLCECIILYYYLLFYTKYLTIFHLLFYLRKKTGIFLLTMLLSSYKHIKYFLVMFQIPH